MDTRYQSYPITDKETWISSIISKCANMEADDWLEVFDFGANKDLKLEISKDSDYNKNSDDDRNFVIISTAQVDKNTGTLNWVDETECIDVTDGELYKELIRIWNYKDFATL